MSFLDNLSSLTDEELVNAMPDEQAESNPNHRYIPKFIPKGEHTVTITEISLETNANDKPYFKLLFADANGSTIKHNQFILNKTGDGFNTFLELFVRSYAQLEKLQKARFMKAILEGENYKTLIGFKNIIKVDYKNEGYSIERDEETKEYFFYDRGEKAVLFDGKGFKDFKEAKSFIDRYNTECEVPLKQAYLEIKSFKRLEQVDPTQQSSAEVLIAFASTNKPKPKTVSGSEDIPKAVPRRVVK